MNAVFARIALRYVAAFLIAKGLLAPDLGDQISADPDIIMALELAAGAAVGAAAEGWYYLAHRFGWAK